MYAMPDSRITLADAAPATRPVSTRAAFGIWAAASVGGWLVVGGLLRILGVF